jgi:hypothetical protein
MTKESEEYKKNKYYIKYVVQRDKIKEKYKDIIVGNHAYQGPPPRGGYPLYSDAERKRHRKYLKELGDLMYKKNGYFQKFMWDTLSEVETLARERRTRRRINDSDLSY